MTEQGSLWEFCLEIYDVPGVEELCLHLQDHQHISVSLLLWCAWLEMERRPLSAEALAAGQARSGELEDALLADLRRLRRLIKGRGLLPASAEKEVRHHILEAELCAEKQLLAELQALSAEPGKKLSSPTPLERLAVDRHLPQTEQWLRELRAAIARVSVNSVED